MEVIATEVIAMEVIATEVIYSNGIIKKQKPQYNKGHKIVMHIRGYGL